MRLALQLCQAQKKVWREVRDSASSPSFHSQPQKFFLKIIMKYLYQFVFSLIRERRILEAGFGSRVREALLGKHCSLSSSGIYWQAGLVVLCSTTGHLHPVVLTGEQCNGSFWQIAWLFCYKEFDFPRMNYEDFFFFSLFVVLGLSYLKMCSLSYHALPCF